MIAIELLSKLKKSKAGVLLLLPSLCLYTLFLLYPLVKTLYNSFFTYTVTQHKFVGFANYVNLLTDTIFLKAIKNTLMFVVISVPLTLVFALIVALIISKLQRQYLYMSLFYLPHVASGVSVFLTWKAIYELDGILNQLTGLQIDWLGDPHIALYALIAVLIYIAVGQPIILFTAAIQNIPASYFEAAEMDGINWIQRIWYITLPLIKPTVLYLLVIRTIGAFNVFVIVQLLTGGGPFYSTSTIAYQLYKTAFQFNQYGLASTMGSILLFIVVGLTIIQWKFLKSNFEY